MRYFFSSRLFKCLCNKDKMDAMEKVFSVTLQSGKITDVFFAKDIKDLSSQLSSYSQNALWVFDTNTAPLFKNLPPNRVVLESGEKNKNLKSIERIISAALDYHLARDSYFIAFGGGVVCDMTALASSLYMRGTKLVLVPTTLLCMVDASVGGKTAIDYAGAKNLIGTFNPAQDVLISCDTLRTLSESEYISGLGEVLKHALLSKDEELYNFLVKEKDKILSRDRDVVSQMVKLSIEVKNFYIESDPEEKKGIRSALNLGHTFAHALESITHFTGLSHGKAVAWGCGRALDISYELGLIDNDFYTKANNLFNMYPFDMDYRVGRGEWLEFQDAISKDKKRMSGSVKFVLLEGFGKPVLKQLDMKLVQRTVISGPAKSNNK